VYTHERKVDGRGGIGVHAEAREGANAEERQRRIDLFGLRV